MSIYLDYAASTPMSESVIRAMMPYFQHDYQNPSAIYLSAKKVRRDIEEARHGIAQTIGAKSGEIIFTAGGSEANNLVVLGVRGKYPSGEILCSSIEHASVLAPASKTKAEIVKVDPKGVVDLDGLKKQITSKTVLVSVMLVNNEIGTVQPVREIAKIIKQEKLKRATSGNDLPIYLHTDACQAANYLDLNINSLGVDFMTINGSKIYGPKQAGLLYIRGGVDIEPIIFGGGQERNLRSGTENVSSIIGMAQAFIDAQKHHKSESRRVLELRDIFESTLRDSKDVQVTAAKSSRAPHITHVTVDGRDNETLAMQLDELGIESAVGSACSAYDSDPSHVLTAIGMGESMARSSLRFSFGKLTSKEDAKMAALTLLKIVNNR